MSDCPPHAILESFLREGLSVEDQACITLHVDRCMTCQSALERFTRREHVILGHQPHQAEVSAAAHGDPSCIPSETAMPLQVQSTSAAAHWSKVAQETWKTVALKSQISPPGEIGRYEILEEIDRGGMGIVYRARDCSLDRVVALKMLIDGEYAKPQARARLQNEAQCIALLHHPNIVELYDLGNACGQPFLVLEYMPGGTLTERLKNGPWPPREAAKLVQVLAEAIQAAHAEGIVHRDLKPSNILYAADGRPKIADFGIARLRSDGVTRTGDVVGSVDFMSPEQATGGLASPESDVYALGGILYSLLTGHPPFHHVESSEKLYHVCHREPTPPGKRAPRLPRDLETICLKSLEKQKERRFPTAGEMAEELGRSLKHQPLKIRRPTLWYRTGRWMRRNRALSLVAGVAALLLGVATAWAGISNYRSNLRAILEAESKEEIRIRELLTLGYLRLQSSESGRVDHVLNVIIPEISSRRHRLAAGVGAAGIDLEVRSLKLAAASEIDASRSHVVEIKAKSDFVWPMAAHPAGHAGALGGTDRPYRITRGEAFELPAEVQNGQQRVWYSPRGEYLVFAPAAGGLTLWNEAVSRQLAEWSTAIEERPTVVSVGFLRERNEVDAGSIRILGADGLIRELSLPDLLEDETLSIRLPQLPAAVRSCAFSADASQLALGDTEGNAWIVDNDGIIVNRFTAGKESIEVICWSPDSKLLALGMKSGATVALDLDAHEWRFRFSVQHVRPNQIFFSPNGRRLFIGQPGIGTTVLDGASGELLLTIPATVVGCSHDDRRLVAADGEKVEFWDWRESPVSLRCAGHRSQVIQTAWAADSSRFATLDSSFELCVWDADDGRRLRRVQLPSGDLGADNGGMALDAEGQLVCVAYQRSDKGIAYILRVEAGEMTEPIELPSAGFIRVAYRADRQRFLIASDDKAHPRQMELRTVLIELSPNGDASPPVILRREVAGEKMNLDQQLTPDGKYYSWIGPRVPKTAQRTEIWEVDSGKRVEMVSLPYPDGKDHGQPLTVTSSNGRHLWIGREIERDEVSCSQSMPELVIHRTPHFTIDSSASDEWAIRYKPNSRESFPRVLFQVHRLADEQPLVSITGNLNAITAHRGSIRFSPDSQKLVWGNLDGTVRLMDLQLMSAVIDRVD